MERRMQVVLVLILFLAIGFSCRKQWINAHDITFTDVSGNVIGPPDQSDWGYTENWSYRMSRLFYNFPDTVDQDNFTSISSFFAIAYPNPAKTVISFHFSTSNPNLIKWVITDEELKPILKGYFVSSNNSNFQVDLSDPQFQKGNYYRIFYTLNAHGKDEYLKGHGDFLKN